MPNAFDIFENYLTEKVTVSAAEWRRIRLSAAAVSLRRGERLLQTGEIWKYRALVAQGLLRTYRTDEKGLEYTVRFALENWWVGDGESYLTEYPSVYTIEALEPSEIIRWKKEDFELLNKEIPALHELSELLMSRNLIASQHQLFQANSQTAEEKYYQFLAAYPALAQRVPLHLIASYLGVTRETLSRVRRK